MTMSELRKRCKAVIEHLFDNHTYCDSTWCRKANVTKEVDELIDTIDHLPTLSHPLANTVSPEEKDHPPSPNSPEPTDNSHETNKANESYYHSKEYDFDLYNQLIEAYEKFTTPERLAEILHPFDTQLNEALHHVIAKYAPKHKISPPPCPFQTVSQ